jgi:hypothetical protein
MKLTWSYNGSKNQLDITDWMDENQYKFPNLPNDIEPFCEKYVKGVIHDDEAYLNNKTFTISEYSLTSTKFEFPFQKPNYNDMCVKIVYFANLFMRVDALDLVRLQLEAFINTGLLQQIANSKLFIVISVCKTKEQEALNRLTSFFENYELESKIEIITNHDNAHEYPGILKVYELSQTTDCVILYFHSKGITRFKTERDEHEIYAFDIVIKNWKWVLFLFKNVSSIDKIGISTSHYGWMWSNFWWVRSVYVRKLEFPVKTNRRHYYEDWVARELPLKKDLNNDGAPIYDYSTRKMIRPEIQVPYILRHNNCWSLIHSLPRYLNIGTPHSDFDAYIGSI